VQIIKKKVKPNGLSMPFHPLQILAWFVILLDFYDFYFINIVSLSYNIALATCLGVAYFILLVAILVLGIRATKSDPTDPTIYEEREAEAKGYVFLIFSL